MSHCRTRREDERWEKTVDLWKRKQHVAEAVYLAVSLPYSPRHFQAETTHDFVFVCFSTLSLDPEKQTIHRVTSKEITDQVNCKIDLSKSHYCSCRIYGPPHKPPSHYGTQVSPDIPMQDYHYQLSSKRRLWTSAEAATATLTNLA
jgi:hypothetical protein